MRGKPVLVKRREYLTGLVLGIVAGLIAGYLGEVWFDILLLLGLLGSFILPFVGLLASYRKDRVSFAWGFGFCYGQLYATPPHSLVLALWIGTFAGLLYGSICYGSSLLGKRLTQQKLPKEGQDE